MLILFFQERLSLKMSHKSIKTTVTHVLVSYRDTTVFNLTQSVTLLNGIDWIDIFDVSTREVNTFFVTVKSLFSSSQFDVDSV